MGAWGTAVLEDDTALDFMEEQLLAAEAPLHVMRGSFEAALAAEYVDYEVGHAVLVSATALRALQKGEPFKDEEQEEWAAWRQAHARLDTDSVKNPAAQACLKVAAAQSELKHCGRRTKSSTQSGRRGLSPWPLQLAANNSSRPMPLHGAA